MVSCTAISVNSRENSWKRRVVSLFNIEGPSKPNSGQVTRNETVILLSSVNRVERRLARSEFARSRLFIPERRADRWLRR